MKNKEMSNVGKYWEDLSKKIQTANETKNKRSDTSAEEAEYIKQFLTSNDELLDIGSGTGLVINKLYPFVKHITAVETFKGFSDFIEDNDKIDVINAKIEGFRIRKEFDVITTTALMQYFPKETASEIYASIFSMLKEGGTYINRTHCGLKETIEINHSDELNSNYFAEYRQIEEEREMLLNAGFREVEIRDEAPKALNIYENTRHFYLICKK